VGSRLLEGGKLKAGEAGMVLREAVSSWTSAHIPQNKNTGNIKTRESAKLIKANKR